MDTPPLHQAWSICSEAVVDTALLERQAAERAAEDARSEYKAGRYPFGLFEYHHDPIIQYQISSNIIYAFGCSGMLMKQASARIRVEMFRPPSKPNNVADLSTTSPRRHALRQMFHRPSLSVSQILISQSTSQDHSCSFISIRLNSFSEFYRNGAGVLEKHRHLC